MPPLLRLLLAVWAVVGGTTVGRTATQEAYVWQRQFDEEVVEAVKALAPQLDGVCVLAAEVSWKPRPELVRPAVNYRALAALGTPVGLALRINDYAGAFAQDDATARMLVSLLRGMLTKAREAGLAVAEVQIDYDCAESKLAGYRQWLAALRTETAAAKTKLVITALPAWLKHADFTPLARGTDGFVLQVHSLERPKGPDAAFVLCDPEKAKAWAKQASATGVLFRIALPTYGYLLGFDAAGKFLGLAAEGARPTWPAGTQQRVVRADAAAMARLARELRVEPPKHCTGVIWFRLPVARDRYNWHAKTFSTVLRGEMPVKRIEAAVEWPERGLAEIVIENRGQTTEPLPAVLALKWSGDMRVLAADGIGGFRLEIRGGEAQGNVRAANVTTDAVLAPGGKVRIAWLRFPDEISLEVSLPAAP
ncbi:MAG: DUF3142 domain-containing protein [Verrucomicrobiota bacterium]